MAEKLGGRGRPSRLLVKPSSCNMGNIPVPDETLLFNRKRANPLCLLTHRGSGVYHCVSGVYQPIINPLFSSTHYVYQPILFQVFINPFGGKGRGKQLWEEQVIIFQLFSEQMYKCAKEKLPAGMKNSFSSISKL